MGVEYRYCSMLLVAFGYHALYLLAFALDMFLCRNYLFLCGCGGASAFANGQSSITTFCCAVT